MNSVKQKKGFTLVELIGVITILSILLVILVPMIGRLGTKSKVSLRESKINTLETAGEEYGNEIINKYQKCIGSGTALNGCTVSISTLIANGYLESEDDEEHIIDPLTNKAMNGEVLLCYNPKNVNVYATYIEDESQYSCSEFSVNGNNSLNLSSIAGVGYVGGDRVDVNIIKSGSFSGGFRCISEDTAVASCRINGSVVEITPTKNQFTEDYREVPITITGTYSGGSLSKTYTFRVYPTALSIIDHGTVCLPTASTDTYELDKLNEGELSVTSSDSTILEGTAKDGLLYIASKNNTGEVTLEIRESHGNNSSTITRNVYNLKVGGQEESDKIPSSLIIHSQVTVPIVYANTGALTITSTDPEVVHFSSKSNPEASSITLNGDDEFTIIANKAGSAKIMITGSTCGTYEADFAVSNISLAETSGTTYTGAGEYTVEIITENSSDLECTSSDPDAADCTTDATSLVVMPGNKPSDDVVLTIKGPYGIATYHVKVLPTSIEIVDRSGIRTDKICTELGSGVNDKDVFARGENMGETIIFVSDPWELAETEIQKDGLARQITIANRENRSNNTIRPPYHDGFNTGRTDVSIKELNGNKTASFNYYIYSLSVDKTSAAIKVDDTTDLIVTSSASGEISATSSDPEIASVTIENNSNYNFEPNSENIRTIKVTGNSTGTAIITIRGEFCGEKRVRVTVSGKTLSIKLEPGTYTSRLGSTSLSCTTSGIFRNCEVTFPEIYTSDEYRVIGYSKTKDDRSFDYKPGDKITINYFNNGTTYYGNSGDSTRPVCTIADASNNAIIGETTYYNLTCIDTGSGLASDDITKENFTTTDASVGEVTSITEKNAIASGYSYKVGVMTKKAGMFGITLKENSVYDRFDNGNAALSLTNIFASEYEAIEIWPIGKDNPNDVIAVLYDNTDVTDAPDDGRYSLKIYGTGKMLDFMCDEYPYYTPWYEGYRSQISRAEVGNNITNIGSSLLYNASNLESLTIANTVTDIGERAFANANLSSLDIPSSVLNIKEEAFYNNRNLGILNLQENVTSIGSRAFYNHKIESLDIPASTRTIGPFAFGITQTGTSNLKNLSFEDGSRLDAIEEGAFIYHSIENIAMPSTLRVIGPRAFASLDLGEHATLKNLTFAYGSKLETIGEEAFLGSNLDSLSLPDSLTSIGESAFSGIRGQLRTLNIPANITFLGENFINGKNLEELSVDAANRHYTSIDGVIYTSSLDTLIKCPDNYYKNHTVLNVLNSVTTIEKGAFSGWLSFSENATDFALNLPSSIANLNIEDNFILFTVGSINISDNSLFESIDGVLFSKNLKVVYRLPTGYNETDYILPDGVETIAPYFAYGNFNVNTISVPSSVTNIGPYAFATDPDYALASIDLQVEENVSFDSTSFGLMTYESVPIGNKRRTIKVASETLKNRIYEVYRSAPYTIETIVK
ncbi:MAG TPA: hypothetical protein DCY94_00110 [Firmicutes bacterium]|nr:hypothetical protein [Bacillota bacterium]